MICVCVYFCFYFYRKLLSILILTLLLIRSIPNNPLQYDIFASFNASQEEHHPGDYIFGIN
jgi:hypothetical protein